MAFYDSAKHKKPLVNQRFGASAKVDGIHYKTCRLLILLGPFSQKDPRKYKKALGSE